LRLHLNLQPTFPNLLSFIFAAAVLRGQTNYGGVSQTFVLLDSPAGARPLAMGTAFEAVADDSSGIYYNPAAPALSRGPDLGVHHEAWLAGTSRENLSLVSPAGPLAVGVSGAWISYPTLELRDDSGNPDGSFSPSDEAVGLDVAGSLNRRFSLGISVHGLLEELPGASVMGAAVAGGLMAAPMDGLRLAVVAQGLPRAGGSMDASVDLGAAALMQDVLGGPTTLALSLRLFADSPVGICTGLEKRFKNFSALAFRAGYSALLPAYSLGPSQGLSLGAGFRIGSLGFDYAWNPWGSFGSAQQFSLDWSFQHGVDKPVGSAPRNPPLEGTAKVPLASEFQLPDPPVSLLPSTGTASTTLIFRVLSDGVVKARALEAAGQFGGAATAYVEALKFNPKDLPAWRSLGLLYDRLGKFEWAKRCYMQVLNLDPGDAEVRAKMGQN
jgi:hypothetical protein